MLSHVCACACAVRQFGLVKLGQTFYLKITSLIITKLTMIVLGCEPSNFLILCRNLETMSTKTSRATAGLGPTHDFFILLHKANQQLFKTK
jgi:hypothetical protein